jgi:hypothetical protein
MLWWLVAAACRTPCGAAGAPPAPETAVDIVQKRVTEDEIKDLIWKQGIGASYAPTTARERDAVAALLPAMIAAADKGAAADPAWARAAAQAGFRVEAWDADGTTFWALVEVTPRGAGAYFVRAGVGADDAAVLLEAPHVYYDLLTEDIGARLFFRKGTWRRPRAFFTNTLHRHQLEPGKRMRRPDSPADVTHNPDHLYTAATEAAARAIGGATVIQLHGFGQSADDGAVPAGTDMVVSAGDPGGSSEASGARAAGLKKIFPGVRRFPEEADALGATTNVQMKALRGVPGSSFVHIEMSSPTRKALVADAAKLAAFGKVIF